MSDQYRNTTHDPELAMLTMDELREIQTAHQFTGEAFRPARRDNPRAWGGACTCGYVCRAQRSLSAVMDEQAAHVRLQQTIAKTLKVRERRADLAIEQQLLAGLEASRRTTSATGTLRRALGL